MMNAEDLELQLHEDGDCDPEECPYCVPRGDNVTHHPADCKCNDCACDEADFRLREIKDNEED